MPASTWRWRATWREWQLGLRRESAGVGALLRQDVLDHYRRQERTTNRSR
ncbi:hypothetical protein [Streptomyces thermodiastaticus]|nr:hypothetical protein [Streptomyces thermodiastaticus]MCE7552162.1 hypothetical protein [Streptomyces thermodiastaticus]